MTGSLDEMIREWDGLGVIHSHDVPTGARIFIALHDARLGPPVGGTRMKKYPDAAAALRDAMRLAEGMTYKWAAIDLPFGGGKAVVDVPGPLEGEARRGFFRRYGRLLETLSGSFATGVDLGVTPEDMDVAAAETGFVFGVPAGTQTTVDPGPYTALGVLGALEEAVAHSAGNSGDLAGASVLVQGLGDVGEPLARTLAETGARLLLADVDRDRAARLAEELSDGGAVEVVDPEAVYETSCDAFAPCAVGAVLNARTIPRLRCGIVAGSANNQLEEPEDAERLRDRGILWVPDYVANAGGALAFGLLHRGVQDPEELRIRVEGLRESVRQILDEAEEREESPLHSARRLAEARLRGS